MRGQRKCERDAGFRGRSGSLPDERECKAGRRWSRCSLDVSRGLLAGQARLCRSELAAEEDVLARQLEYGEAVVLQNQRLVSIHGVHILQAENSTEAMEQGLVRKVLIAVRHLLAFVLWEAWGLSLNLGLAPFVQQGG